MITPFLTDVINSLLLSLEKGTLSAKQLMQKKFHWNFFHLGKIHNLSYQDYYILDVSIYYKDHKEWLCDLWLRH